METTKTTRKIAVLNRPFRGKRYGLTEYPVGLEFVIGGVTKLTEEGLVIIPGHGFPEVIPNDHFDLFIEEEEVIVKLSRQPA